jgi:predicted nucleotidyltransferase
MSSSQSAKHAVSHAKRVPIAYLLKTYRSDILRLAKEHGARNVRVFGSVARGEATATSDLDLLIELAPDRSLLDRIGLIQDLEDLLGIRVHVVTEKGLHPDMREAVIDDARAL